MYLWNYDWTVSSWTENGTMFLLVSTHIPLGGESIIIVHKLIMQNFKYV